MFLKAVLSTTLGVSLLVVTHGSGAASAASAEAGDFEIVHQFREGQGQYPNGSLVQGSHGKLYGTTSGDFRSGEGGTVFRLSLSRRFSTAHTFSREKFDDGFRPYAGLLQAADGNFYGTTRQGGARRGTLFRLSPKGEYTLLHQFAGKPLEGAYPEQPLIQASDGNLYGTTAGGGAENLGTVYRVSPAGEVTLVHSFKVGQGRAPSALIEASDGNFYGLSNIGRDTIFRLSPAGHFEIVHIFDPGDSDGAMTGAPLIQAKDGNLYGVGSTSNHGFGGAVFRLSPAGEYTVLHRFIAEYPSGPLVQIDNGDFYGVTSDGGANYAGSIYRLRAGDFQFETVHDFSGRIDGDSPEDALIQASDGWLYGAANGGRFQNGMIFRFKPK